MKVLNNIPSKINKQKVIRNVDHHRIHNKDGFKSITNYHIIVLAPVFGKSRVQDPPRGELATQEEKA